MSSSRATHARKSFRLLALGGLALLAPDGSVVRQQRRRLALLALLAAGGKRGVSRDKLILWLSPQSTTDSARHSLHQLLYYLRQQAGDSAFIGTDPLSLNPEVFASDYGDFERAVENGSLAEAAELYKGPFLDGFHLPDSAEFDQWAMGERSRLASIYSELIIRLAADATSRNDHVAAIRWGRQLTDQDPLSGRAAIGLMRSLEAAGDGPAALRHARGHEALVRAELGSAPDPGLAVFVERHRASALAPVAPQNGELHSSNGANAIVVSGNGIAMAIPDAINVGARQPNRRPAYLIAACVVATVAFGLFLADERDLFSRSVTSSDQLSRARQVVVGDFKSHRDDSAAARAFSALLRGSLVDSRAVSVVSRSHLDRALERMELPINTPIDFRIALELAGRNGYEAILVGEITRVGAGYIVSAQLTRTDGRDVATFGDKAASDDALMDAIGRISMRMRREMGESASSLDSVRPLSEVTTRSWIAAQRYTQAQEEDRAGRGGAPWALSLLRDAIAADSTFASAHRLLGIKLYNLGKKREAIRELRSAERFSDRLTDVERFQALSGLHLLLRDYVRAAHEAEHVLKLKPEMLWAFNQVAILDNLLGRFDHSLEIARRRSKVDTTGFSLGPAAAIYQGRVAEGIAMWRAVFINNRERNRTGLSARGRIGMAWGHAAAANYDSVDYYVTPNGSTAALEGVAKLTYRGDPELLARSQLARGQIGKAFTTLGVRARGAERRVSRSSFSAVDESVAASATVVMLGDRASASRRLDAVMTDTAFMSLDPADQPVDAILALALAGRAREARAALARIEDASDADMRSARDPELSLARGAVALAERKFTLAIASLRHASASYMLSDVACRVCVLPLLGRAYEAADEPDSAAAVYERFLLTGDPDRPLPDGLWRANVLARLGDLHARRGNTAQAIARLEEFVSLWRDADSELQPQVDIARRQLVKLRNGGKR